MNSSPALESDGAVMTCSRSAGGRAPRDPAPGQSPREQGRFFTVDEVAERLGVCDRTVRRWVKRGDLLAHRISHLVRIAESDLKAFLAQRRGI